MSTDDLHGSRQSTEPSMSMPPSDEPLTMEQLQGEYARYKAKTKEWQQAVKQRDLKMREQLKAGTVRIQEQEAQLTDALKKAADLELRLKDLPQLERDVARAYEDTDRAVAAAKSKLSAIHEQEVATQRDKITQLRQTIESLETDLRAERRGQDGSAFFEKGSTTNSISVLHTAEVKDGPTSWTYCLCRRVGGSAEGMVRRSSGLSSGATGEELRWFELSTLQRYWSIHREKTDGLLKVPPSQQQEVDLLLLKNSQESADVFHKQEVEINERHAVELKELNAAHSMAMSNLEETHTATVAKFEADILVLQEQLSTQVNCAIDAQRAAWEQKFADLTSKHQQEVGTLQRESQARMGALEEKCGQLEQYKAKAQIALKRAKMQHGGGGTNTPPDQPLQAIPPLERSVVMESSPHHHLQPLTVSSATQCDIQPSADSSEGPRSDEQDNSSSLEEAHRELQEKFKLSLVECQELHQQVGNLTERLQVEKEALTRKYMNERVEEFNRLNTEIDTLRKEHARSSVSPHHHRRGHSSSSGSGHITGGTEETPPSSILCSHCQRLVRRVPSGSSGDDTPTRPHRPPYHMDPLTMDDGNKEGDHICTSVGGDGAVQLHSTSGSGFNLSELLSANSEALRPDREAEEISRLQAVIAQLRADIAQLSSQVAQAKYELSEASLAEEKHLAQEKLLKQQLREQDESQQRRESFESNSDYIKNIIIKFIAAEDNPSMRKSLVPVLCQLLALSDKERQVVEAIYK